MLWAFIRTIHVIVSTSFCLSDASKQSACKFFLLRCLKKRKHGLLYSIQVFCSVFPEWQQKKLFPLDNQDRGFGNYNGDWNEIVKEPQVTRMPMELCYCVRYLLSLDNPVFPDRHTHKHACRHCLFKIPVPIFLLFRDIFPYRFYFKKRAETNSGISAQFRFIFCCFDPSNGALQFFHVDGNVQQWFLQRNVRLRLH